MPKRDGSIASIAIYLVLPPQHYKALYSMPGSHMAFAEDTPLDAASLEDERGVELSSIAAIFPELIIDSFDPFSASLELAVTPSHPLAVGFQSPSSAGAIKGRPIPRLSAEEQPALSKQVNPGLVRQTAEEAHHLSHLPTLSLKIELPEGYPTENPPTFTLSTSPAWIPRHVLHRLQAVGKSLWQDLGKDQVVFAYIDHLQQAAERAFDLFTTDEQCLVVAGDLKIALLDYDIQTKQRIFDQQTFVCGICLDPKKGSACHQLPCSHVFCVQCLQAFYNNCITEGDIASVKCLDPGCGKGSPRQEKKRRKEDRTLGPSELLRLHIQPDMVKRYVHLRRKVEVEADRNTVYCPRKWCQGIARSKKHPKPSENTLDTVDHNSKDDSDNDAEPEDTEKLPTEEDEEDYVPPGERLAICEDCRYAFCRVCHAGWHGELIRCLNPNRRAKMTAEEKASEEYIKRHSSPCPTCNAPCQKSMGCNHMICFKCKTHFCYLCSAWLAEQNPYAHYNNTKSGCYMKLWQLEGGDGADEPAVGPVEMDAPAAVDAALVGNNPGQRAPPPPPQPQPQRPAARRPQAAVREVAQPIAARRVADRRLPTRNNGDHQPVAPDGNPTRRAAAGNQGLRRFLEMVEDDEEDEWDSDELDDDENQALDWEIPLR